MSTLRLITAFMVGLIIGVVVTGWVFGDSVRWATEPRECEAILDSRGDTGGK